jgi:uncharacterized protein (DUF1015 family)
MAVLAPFRALRPAPSAATSVAAVPYDVVNADEARALAAGNPLSFLHVSRAEIDCPGDLNPYDARVYEQAVWNFERLRQDAPLVVEDAASLYVYRLRMGDVTQTGVAGGYSLDEYDHDVIKKHERTRQDKEDDRTRHLLALRAQTGPVFLIHRAAQAIDQVVERVATSQRPLYEFTAADEVTHTVWRVDGAEQGALIGAFAEVPRLYIADGHHRAASAARARRQLRGAGAQAGEWDTFPRIAGPHPSVQPPRVRPRRPDAADVYRCVTAAIHGAGRSSGPRAPRRRGDVSQWGVAHHRAR